jgi:hypothetical protein
MDVFNWLTVGSFEKFFDFGKGRELTGTRYGQHGACSIDGICFSAKN